MNIFLALKCIFEKRAIFLIANKIQIKSNKWFLIFSSNSSIILEKSYYLHLFDLIWNIFRREKLLKSKSSFHYLIKIKYENRKIPNSLRGSLSCLGFRGLRNGNAINHDMHGWSMYNIPNWKFGMLQTYPPLRWISPSRFGLARK